MSKTTSDDRHEHGEVVVRGRGDGYAQEITVGDHLLRADEPLSVEGGTDTGPNPYDLLLAALGACKSMTMRMYAERKGWPLEAVRVRLRHEKIHAADCEDCEAKGGMVDDIAVSIDLEGPLSDAQRARLLEISGRCPVHRTLENEVRIRLES
jgi:putative redox protein